MAKLTIREHIINLEGLREDGATKKDIRDYLFDEGVTEKEAKDLQTIIQSSTTANRLRQLGQGLTFGFGDEIEGSIRSLLGGGTRDEEIDKARAQVKAYEDLLPYESMGLQIAGGLPSGLLGAGRAAVGSGARMIPKIFRGASAGTFHGGLSGAGRAEEGKRLEGAETGAKFGAATGAAFPVVTGALKGAGKFLGKAFAPTTTQNIQANMMLRRAMDDDALTPDLIQKGLTQLPAKLGRIPDVAGKRANALRDLTRAAIAQQGQKGGAKFLGERQDEAGMRALESVDTNLANEGLDDFLDKTSEIRRITANKNYDEFYKNPVQLDQKLKNFFENDAEDFDEAYKMAKTIARREGIQLPPLFEVVDGNKVFAQPNARMLDYIKQGMDALVDRTYKNEGGTLGKSLQKVRDDYRDHLDKIMPDYPKARSEYAGLSAAMEAAEIGEKFINNPRKIGLNILERMGDHEKEAFQVGVAEALRYKIMNTDEGLNVAKKLFNKPEIKKRLRLAFTDEASFKKFEQDMNNEIQMFQTGERGLGGSPTKRIEMDVDALGVANDLGNMNVSNLVGRMFGESPDAPEEVNARISELLLDKAKEEEALKILSSGSPALRNAGSRIPSILRNVLSQQSQRISE